MRPIIAQVKNGQMELGDFNKALLQDWMKANNGKKIRIEPQELPSYSVRKFFEAAVVPYFFYQHNKGVFDNFKEAREALKVELYPVWIKDISGNRLKVGGSTAGKNKEWWNVFLEKAADLFMSYGYEFPDSAAYKKWIESSPMINEIYPPLQRLIEAYKFSTDGN